VKLRYTQTALRQIDGVLDHVHMHSPQGAARLRSRILASLSLVCDHPNAGQITSRRDLRRVVLTPYPYVLFYRISNDEIIVMRFRHAARKPLPTA